MFEGFGFKSSGLRSIGATTRRVAMLGQLLSALWQALGLLDNPAVKVCKRAGADISCSHVLSGCGSELVCFYRSENGGDGQEAQRRAPRGKLDLLDIYLHLPFMALSTPAVDWAPGRHVLARDLTRVVALCIARCTGVNLEGP